VVAAETIEAAPTGGQLLLHGERVRLEPLGLDLEPPGISDDLLARTADLLRAAFSEEPGEKLTAQPRAADPDATVETSRFGGSLGSIDLRPGGFSEGSACRALLEDDPDRVLIRILGPLEIRGGESPIDRRRVKELVVYLALHPRGVTEAQIKDALWDEEPSRSAFNQTVSRARTALGRASDGALHIPNVSDCLYRPGPHLITDWQILEAAWERARRSPGDADASRRLSRCLGAVAGPPFEGTKGFEWAYEEGIPHRIQAVLEEASQRSGSQST
jgi:hypothetical protein